MGTLGHSAEACQSLNVSTWLNALCRDVADRLPEMNHIKVERLMFCLSRSRAQGKHGVYARIAPLRFAGGQEEMTRRRGRYQETFALPKVTHEGRNILYVIYLMVPRLLRLSFHEKLRTIVHELYHISPACDGDLRRFPGRNYAHGSSRASYNRRIDKLVDAYLKTSPPAELLQPLSLCEEQWQRGTIRITGLHMPLPRARLVARTRL